MENIIISVMVPFDECTECCENFQVNKTMFFSDDHNYFSQFECSNYDFCKKMAITKKIQAKKE